MSILFGFEEESVTGPEYGSSGRGGRGRMQGINSTAANMFELNPPARFRQRNFSPSHSVTQLWFRATLASRAR